MTQNTLTKWLIDTGHSQVQFKVKHLAIANVAGTFKMFKGEVQTINGDFGDAKVSCIIDAASIDTNNERRDNDLRSQDFFNTAQFPEIIFEGQLIKKDNTYELAGNLTIRGIVRHAVMAAQYTGAGKGRFGDSRAGFEITGKVNRKDFGLSWNLLTETGSFVIGEEIKLSFDIELILQA